MKTRFLITLGTAMVVGAALITGPTTAIGKVGENTPITDSSLTANTKIVLAADGQINVKQIKVGENSPITDSWMTAKTKIALAADGRVKGRQINVETQNGLVMLRGKVDSNEAKNASEEIAKGIDGVKSVKNELQVVAPSVREAVEVNDDVITEHVKKQMSEDKSLANIGVQTNAGVVSLNGEVRDILTSAHASWTAWNVPGVKSVKNDLTLEEKK